MRVAKTSTSAGSPITSFLWCPASPPGPSRSCEFSVWFYCGWRKTYFQTRRLKHVWWNLSARRTGRGRTLGLQAKYIGPDVCLHFVATVKDGMWACYEAVTQTRALLLGNVGWNLGALSVIFVPLQYHELLILSSGPFSPCLHFLETTSISTQRVPCLFLPLFPTCHVFTTFATSSCYLIFSLKLPNSPV